MSDAPATPNPYQCPKCWAPIPSGQSSQECKKCGAAVSGVKSGGESYTSDSPLRSVGYALLISGVVVCAGLGFYYKSVDSDVGNAIVRMTLNGPPFDRSRVLVLEKKRDDIKPWMMAGAFASVVGLALLLSAPAGRSKRCGKCAESVLVDAKVCKHCGNEF